MVKTNPLSFRVEPEVKAALEKAAMDDDRSVSALVERVLKEWLGRRGYLPRELPSGRSRRKAPGG